MLEDEAGPFRRMVVKKCPWAEKLLKGTEADKEALVVLLLASLADVWLKADVGGCTDKTGLSGMALHFAKACAHCAYGFSVLRWLGRYGQQAWYLGGFMSQRDMMDLIKNNKIELAEQFMECFEQNGGQQPGGTVTRGDHAV